MSVYEILENDLRAHVIIVYLALGRDAMGAPNVHLGYFATAQTAAEISMGQSPNAEPAVKKIYAIMFDKEVNGNRTFLLGKPLTVFNDLKDKQRADALGKLTKEERVLLGLE